MNTNLFKQLTIACAGFTLSLAAIPANPAQAASFSFNTGSPDGKIATASRPSSPGKVEIETGDDFILSQQTKITKATFTGLLTNGATLADIQNVIVEIYRVFPKDSQNPPDGKVPTRVNSPSDVALASRDSSSGLTFNTTLINSNFTAANSVINGINPIPNQTTGGEGSVSGQEVQFNISFDDPFSLPADHYFFVPQVAVSGGDFLWLSAPKPIVSPGTPFNPDLQTWIRNEPLQPDWLRIGTDIVAAAPFNASFSLEGTTSVPEPQSTSGLMLVALGLGWMMRNKKKLPVL
ncbi:PEP-CTERM sorting domain-containing protein [Nostoc sp. MS1]|uniref:PEP-CTERM sorting domain-containing protein n=1 Tax=Nostoc sp. MS1 TaxID=2764711 RepID=UPI001CC4512B|nr:PEP-CTERM sorting domain-containing protein [Nostoc sp. MS1]